MATNKNKKKGVDVKKLAQLIEVTLESLDITARVVEVNQNDKYIDFNLEIALGTPLESITKLHKDLAMSLASPTGDVEIIAPIPGRSLVGIRVPLGKITKHMIKDVKTKVIIERDTFSKIIDVIKSVVSKGLGNGAVVEFGKKEYYFQVLFRKKNQMIVETIGNKYIEKKEFKLTENNFINLIQNGFILSKYTDNHLKNFPYYSQRDIEMMVCDILKVIIDVYSFSTDETLEVKHFSYDKEDLFLTTPNITTFPHIAIKRIVKNIKNLF